MTRDTKNSQGKQSKTRETSSCMDMMAKMMGQPEEGASCVSIISQLMSEDDIPEEWLQKMSGMAGSMSSCCRTPAEAKKE